MREHVGNLSEPELLKMEVWNRLGDFGIDAPSRKRSRSKRISSTPCPSEKKRRSVSRLFGVPLRDLALTRVSLGLPQEGISVSIPEFIPRIISYIRADLGREGLFRLSGSESRQRLLRERLENFENEDFEISVIDAAAILKHWLRELPDPIVPEVYQDVMLRCCSLPSSDVDTALRLASCLLPEVSSSTLSYLFRFFDEVTSMSDLNKMDVRNLAIVLAPNFFPLASPNTINSKKGCSLESTKNILNLKTQIVEKLIYNANEICMVEGSLAAEYSSSILKMAPNFTSHSEDNLDDNPAGPSERRSRKKKKKHRRSGSLSRVITAFKGIISRSNTPAQTRAPPVENGACAAQTPDSFFSSPILCKRKTNINSQQCAAVKVQQQPQPEEVKHSVVEAFEHNYFHCSPKIPKLETPKLRGKSFSVKRFKKKKLCKANKGSSSGGGLNGGESTTLVNFSPLRSRISLVVPKTPATPDVIAGAFNADRDLSDDEPAEEDYREVNNVSETSSIASSNSLLRRGQPNSLHSGLSRRSSPKPHSSMEHDSSSSRRVLRKEDSLAYLKKDLSILIESSFAAASETSSLSSLDEESARNVEEIINKMRGIEMSGLSPLTRSQLRRQSLEVSKDAPEDPEGMRRQSSAFENNKQDCSNNIKASALKRGDTFRASLARKNSSVRDLVRRIESSKVPPFLLIPETSPQEAEPEEQWMDATEFFKNVLPVPAVEEQGETHAAATGCRRSSIIRIRNENRGKVSKSVETFTSASSSSRGVSARMGVAAAVANTPSPFVTKRRPQTGIRTTTAKRPPKVESRSSSARSSISEGKSLLSSNKKSENPPNTTTNLRPRAKARNKKSRRHLTIGYLGEPVGTRSPLKERVNVITVQRSKSAQNPLRTEPSKKKKKQRQNSLLSSSENNVQRSHSVKKSELSSVPMTLKDTLYDQESPKSSDKVRRNLSDRVMTPTKGGLKNEAIPYMKSVRSNSRAGPSSSGLGSTPPHNKILHQKLSSLNTPVRKSPRLAKIY